MTRSDRLLERVLRGTSNAGIPFGALRHLLKRLGFKERIRGSHHIFAKQEIEEILNLQASRGKAKPYQVRQIRGIIQKYKLVVGP